MPACGQKACGRHICIRAAIKRRLTMYCRNCGAQIPEGNAFCEQCGMPAAKKADPPETPFPPETPPMPPEWPMKKSPRDKRQKILLVLAVIFAAGICGGLIAAFLSDGYSAEYEEKLDAARQYVADEKLDDAEAAYIDAIEIEPRQEVAYLELSDVYVTQERYEEAITILEEGKTATGKERKFDKRIERVKEDAGYAKEDGAKGGGTKKTEKEKRLELFSDHMAALMAENGDPHAEAGPNESQYASVYDADDDGVPEYIVYSFYDAGDLREWVPVEGFCTVADGRLIDQEVETLYGMSFSMFGEVYAAENGDAYYFRSKGDGEMSQTLTMSITKYVPSAAGFQESLLCEESCSFDDASARKDALVAQYIPSDAVSVGNGPREDPHVRICWGRTLSETAGFLSMYGVTPLPQGPHKNDWKTAYQEYFEGITAGVEFGGAEGEMLRAASEDINGDGIPEVFLLTDTDAGTVNSGTAQCLTFARGRVIAWPDILDEPTLFKGSGGIRIDRAGKKIYYNGLTGGYGNMQRQYILHLGPEGFVTEESFESGWSGLDANMYIRTTHDYEDTANEGEEISSIFSDETYQSLNEPDWQELSGSGALLEFIGGL